MTSKELISALGKTSTSKEVVRLLAALGEEKGLRMPKDDIERRVSLRKKGLNLIFKPSRAEQSKAMQSLRELVLVSVQFISNSEKGYASFSGELPQGLVFADTPAQVTKKLGKPTVSKPQLRLATWKSPRQCLSVDYTVDNTAVSMVSVFLPEYY